MTRFQKFQMLATICIAFIEAARGCPTSAVVFWITLFLATALSGQTEVRRRPSPAKLM
jgi:ABC-type amino acid transport system permease subunit